MSPPVLRANQAHNGCANTLRVFLISGEPLYREGMQSTFRATRSLSLLDGTSIDDAERLAKSRLADLIVIDVHNLGDAVEKVRTLAALTPELPIVTVSARATADEVRCLFEVGVRGCILKGVEGGEFVRILESITQGTPYLPPELGVGVLRQSMRSNGASADRGKPYRLTPRELQILACVARALTNKEVARELKISEKTVKHYMTVIMEKLQVRNRVEAALKAKSIDLSAAS
jgi:two-component system nitrate/nitrite response regulator NarL